MRGAVVVGVAWVAVVGRVVTPPPGVVVVAVPGTVVGGVAIVVGLLGTAVVVVAGNDADGELLGTLKTSCPKLIFQSPPTEAPHPISVDPKISTVVSVIVKVPDGKVRMMVVGADDEPVGDVIEPLGVVECALVIVLGVLLLPNTLLVVKGPVVVGLFVVGVKSEDTEYVGSKTTLVVV